MDQVEAVIYAQKTVAELNAERERKGVSVEQLAVMTGMRERKAHRLLEGERDITMHDLRRLCTALDADFADILARAEKVYQDSL